MASGPWLILGLGNPGAEYARTRHNVGFWVVDALAERHGFAPFRDKFGAAWSKGTIAGADVILAKPQTFMNRSGEPAQQLATFFKVELARVVVVHDELDFEPGVLRVKAGGGAGGHNGLRSLIANLGDGFVRLRIGVGKPPPGRGVDFVLGAPRGIALEAITDACARSADAVDMIIGRGVAAAMEQFNRAAPKI
jgi:PTH1 family peptidyl-tRNA hydrolase